MPSRWYLRNASNAETYGVAGPVAKQSAESDNDAAEPAAKNVCRAATEGVGSAEVAESFSIGAGGGFVMIGTFASPRLGPQEIADGATMTLTMPIRRSGVGAHWLSAFFYVWREGVGKVKDLGADQVTDDVNAETSQRWRQLVAVVSGAFMLANGDQIICEVHGKYAVTFGTRTFDFFFGGAADDYATAGEATDVSDSAAWMEASQALQPATHPAYYPGQDRLRGLKG